MRLIDADNAIHALGVFSDVEHGNKHFLNGINSAKEIINECVTIDAVPVVRGEWVPNKRYDGCMVCDQCGFGIEINTRVLMECNRRSDEREFSICAGDVELAYCPNCGAHMDGKDGE